jgi:hypothetical protein
MAGYTRVDTINNIADGNVINAADLDGEFDGIQSAFNASTGHNHDGTAGEGAPILALGPTQDVTISASVLGVKTTNTVDIGTSSLKFKDLYLAGAASVGGTLGVTGATTLSAALTYGGVTLSNAVTGTGNMVLSASPTLTGTITAAAANFSGAVALNGNATIGDADTDTITQAASYVTGTQLKSAKTATNTLSLAAYDVDGTAYTNLITLTASNTPTLALISTGVGTINNMSIGATTASTGAFTTLTASTSITNSGLTSGRVTYATTAGLLTDSANLLYSGTDLTVYGLTVGRGAGAVSTNTAVGASALAANTSGASNTAIGSSAMLGMTSGGSNSAFGESALKNTTTANANSAFGSGALLTNTTGANNTSVGQISMFYNTTGGSNTALGVSALESNTTASNNTAVGYQAGYTNTTGTDNTFVGTVAGYTSNGGARNTAIGKNAGYNLTTATDSTFIGGSGAGFFVTTGSKNTIIGNYNGNQGGLDIRTLSNFIVLSDGDGNARFYYRGDNGIFYMPALYGNTSGAAANISVSSDGSLYRSTSSLKYKRDVQDASHGLAEVLALRSVTYKGKGSNDGDTVFGGLIAEEVHAAGLTEFVQYAEDGSPDALNYGNMVSLCIKAIQELKAEFDAYKATHP